MHMPRNPRPEPYVKTCVRIPVRQKALLESRARLNSRTFTSELVEAVDRGMSQATLAEEGIPLVVIPFRRRGGEGRMLPCIHRVAAGAYCEVCDENSVPAAS